MSAGKKCVSRVYGSGKLSGQRGRILLTDREGTGHVGLDLTTLRNAAIFFPLVASMMGGETPACRIGIDEVMSPVLLFSAMGISRMVIRPFTD